MSDKPNARPCGTCVHLDPETAQAQAVRGLHYCWRFYAWRHPDELVVDCRDAERATGAEPPGKLHFAGQRTRA